LVILSNVRLLGHTASAHDAQELNRHLVAADEARLLYLQFRNANAFWLLADEQINEWRDNSFQSVLQSFRPKSVNLMISGRA
jgi:hypothetical protein